MLIGGGMTTAITVELLSQIDAASCGVWLTFWQVLGIAITASRSQLSSQNNKMFTPRKIPLLTHCTSAALVVVSMIASNSAIAFQIPLPLHILLKSASLPAAAAASYLSGRLTLDGPTLGAISSVTAGALVATVGGVPSTSPIQRSTSTSTFIGTLLASSSVFASAALGAFQDSVFETCIACEDRFTNAETCDETQILTCKSGLVLEVDKRSCFACVDKFPNSWKCDSTQVFICL